MIPMTVKNIFKGFFIIIQNWSNSKLGKTFNSKQFGIIFSAGREGGGGKAVEVVKALKAVKAPAFAKATAGGAMAPGIELPEKLILPQLTLYS